MAYQYRKTPQMFDLFDADNYVDLMAEFVTRLRPDIVIERFTSESPADLLIAPQWGGLKNYTIADRIAQKMRNQNQWQGKSYSVVN